MQRQFVSKITHDVVTVCPETDDDTCTTEGENPVWDWGAGFHLAAGPDVVDCGIWSHRAGSLVSICLQRREKGGGAHLETSLAPWVKDEADAVITCKKEYMNSALLL